MRVPCARVAVGVLQVAFYVLYIGAAANAGRELRVHWLPCKSRSMVVMVGGDGRWWWSVVVVGGGGRWWVSVVVVDGGGWVVDLGSRLATKTGNNHNGP